MNDPITHENTIKEIDALKAKITELERPEPTARDAYRYSFDESVDFDDVLETLQLAIIAVEIMHGESAARLYARFADDPKQKKIVLDASSDAGRTLNLFFTGLLLRGYGEDALRIERAFKAAPAATPGRGAATSP